LNKHHRYLVSLEKLATLLTNPLHLLESFIKNIWQRGLSKFSLNKLMALCKFYSILGCLSFLQQLINTHDFFFLFQVKGWVKWATFMSMGLQICFTPLSLRLCKATCNMLGPIHDSKCMIQSHVFIQPSRYDSIFS
jgi:hypothetical protein